VRVLIDATAVGEGRGGIVTYLRELLRAWAAAGFGDELLVAGTRDLPPAIDAALGASGRVVRLGGDRRWTRFAVQHVGIPALARSWKPDVLLATTPVVPLLAWGRPMVVVLYDLRYLRRPREFGRVQRWYRTVMYRLGLWRATWVLSISMSTQRDAIATFPGIGSKIETVYLGADQFQRDAGEQAGSHAVAFAHWPNKQPEMSIRAWGVLKARSEAFSNVLHVVGVRPADRPRLAALVDRCGLAGQVRLHGYLDEGAYGRLFSTARLMVMPSTFEGFGLPVIEAMRLGVAVVASDDPAMQEAGEGFALYAPPDAPDALAGQCARLLFDDELHRTLVAGGLRHAETFTWRRTAEHTRAALAHEVERWADPDRRRSRL